MDADRRQFFEGLATRADASVAAQSLPGLIVAVIKDGAIATSWARGETQIGNGTPPTLDSIFRIASMTKSFTAAAILLLRDRGALALDDPIERYLPWTASIGAPPGAPPIAIRDLLTMNGGFPTDDPWGDRHESTPPDAFDRLVAGGLSFTHAPRTGFRYSNLGYALLGRVVTVAGGIDYRDFVARELLEPLGMFSTCFDTAAVDDARRAHGYACFDGTLVPEPPAAPGAFSPMGGLHSSARDLAVWVRGWCSVWGNAEPHPLSAATRREMQEGRTYVETELTAATDTAAAKTRTRLYGYGLGIDIDSALGTFVHHSGGYPGFGSHMRWHPASGWAIVALSNRTYAPMRPLAAAILDDAVTAFPAPQDVAARLWPATRAAMDVAEALVANWNDALADAHFAHNLDLDLPRGERRAAVARVAETIGDFARIEDGWQSASAADVRWRVRGERGEAELAILLTPDRPPKIQAFDVTLAAAEPSE